jgi:hypothetical protein
MIIDNNTHMIDTKQIWSYFIIFLLLFNPFEWHQTLVHLEITYFNGLLNVPIFWRLTKIDEFRFRVEKFIFQIDPTAVVDRRVKCTILLPCAHHLPVSLPENDNLYRSIFCINIAYRRHANTIFILFDRIFLLLLHVILFLFSISKEK